MRADEVYSADAHIRKDVGITLSTFEKVSISMLQKNLLVRMEHHRGPAPVGGRADLFHRPLRNPAGEALFEQLLVLGHLNDHQIRQGVQMAFIVKTTFWEEKKK